MSLDVYLTETKWQTCQKCEHRELIGDEEVYSANITHNLGKMAAEAGIYKALWHPNDSSLMLASQLIQPITDGLALMKSDPERFRKHDAPNGWGTYDQFVPWIEKYLAACIAHPDAKVETST